MPRTCGPAPRFQSRNYLETQREFERQRPSTGVHASSRRRRHKFVDLNFGDRPPTIASIDARWHDADAPVAGIVVERLCHFRVESAQAADVLALRDAQGEIVQISEFAAGGGSSSHDRFALVDGKTPVLFASELATTMVARGEDGERIVPIRLVPGEVTLIRL